MPLLVSAVRERQEHVETARLHTWWHLIGRLGSKKREFFDQVVEGGREGERGREGGGEGRREEAGCTPGSISLGDLVARRESSLIR